MLKKNRFHVRNATLADLPQLEELEKEWPPNARASASELARRLEKFAAGYFIALDKTGMIASIIAHPWLYLHNDLSNCRNWAEIVNKCYHQRAPLDETNAIYIVSGTTKKTPYVTELFNAGINVVVDLAKQMGKRYVVAGALLPGFAKYRMEHEKISACDYVYKKNQGRYIDPLIEKYRRVGFHVPDKNHILENYFPDDNSLGHSALVVKDLGL